MSATALKERLRTDLKAAMQARAMEEIRVLRVLLAALDNAEAVPTQGYRPRALGGRSGEVARRSLDGAALAALLADEVVARVSAAADYRSHGKEAEACRLEAEAAVVERYRTLQVK